MGVKEMQKAIWILAAMIIVVIGFFAVSDYQNTDDEIEKKPVREDVSYVDGGDREDLNDGEVDELAKGDENDPYDIAPNKDWGMEEDGDDDPVRKAYSYSLPPMPDYNEGRETLLGIDLSEPGTPGYKVRDDIEHMIVDYYDDDEMVTLAALAEYAYMQRIFELSEYGKNDALYLSLYEKMSNVSTCHLFYGKRNLDLDLEDDESRREYLKDASEVEDEMKNTYDRKMAEHVVAVNFARGGTIRESDATCKAAIEQAHADMQKDLFSLTN